ncbi:hypothetical protein [Sphingopyxis sp. Root1497]|uniref:hypothetical protein n=1 Tax=Sphingopyxis sp. Root1497 TaxID=1736474 RepID=UPI0012E365DA|nr:hypothetical protein [Sphingopyxis sp. Root1497]
MNAVAPHIDQLYELGRALHRCGLSKESGPILAETVALARNEFTRRTPRLGRKPRDYLSEFSACFPGLPAATSYEQLFFRISILSGLLGSDEKAHACVAAQHPTGRCGNGAAILPRHLADARKNNLKAERARATVEMARRSKRSAAYRRLIASQDPSHGVDIIHTNSADRASQRSAWMAMGG